MFQQNYVSNGSLKTFPTNNCRCAIKHTLDSVWEFSQSLNDIFWARQTSK